ncbi:MAG: Nramp family divalent metal transporter [Opitutaceae bacterium]
MRAPCRFDPPRAGVGQVVIGGVDQGATATLTTSTTTTSFTIAPNAATTGVLTVRPVASRNRGQRASAKTSPPPTAYFHKRLCRAKNRSLPRADLFPCLSMPEHPADTTPPPIPRSFWEYVRSFGPGLVMVLTWLGAGDVIDMGTAGANYGYALIWMFVVAVLLRFVFVSLIARYQLCNQHGEGVLDGLARLHRAYPPLIFAAVIVMGHVYGAYMSRGVGEICQNVFGIGTPWIWALLCNGIAVALVFRPAYRRLEIIFLGFLAVLSVSFLGSALWVGFDASELAKGLVRFEMPGRHGAYDPWHVALAMVGAVGGSLMNLVYPYFLEAKGWRGPQYRRVQFYDLLLGIVMMILLNLAVWILGAELLFPDRHIEKLEDLPNLLSSVLGNGGRLLFYAGIFSAVYTSLVGHAVGLGCLGSHAWMRWRAGTGVAIEDPREHRLYRWIALWCLISPLVWTLPGMPGFVALTLTANSAQVVLLPVLAGGLWWITASARLIGKQYRNRPWENLVMAVLFLLSIYFAVQSVKSLVRLVTG